MGVPHFWDNFKEVLFNKKKLKTQTNTKPEFSVSEDGSVKNIKVVDSSSSVFVTSAIDAASRFRFTPGAAANVRERFNFRLLDGVAPTVNSATL